MIEFGFKSFLTLLVVIDPIGLVPVFLALAGSKPSHVQHRIAGKAVLVAGIVVFAFALIGRGLLDSLGISLEALRIAGGILLFRIAMDMVFVQLTRETPEEAAEAGTRQDISGFPLAIPLIAGPGTLASILVLGAEAKGDPVSFGLILLMAALVLALAYFFLRSAARLSKLLGRTGVNVITRVLGILLAALAVQFVTDGLKGLFTI